MNNTSTRRITRRTCALAPLLSARLRKLHKGTRRGGVYKANRIKPKRKTKDRSKTALSGLAVHFKPTHSDNMAEVEVVTRDPDRPQCHVMPLSGWMNDPNGPIYYRGRYHLFYQHVPNRVEWDWGLVWGHVYSDDLITWKHLPIALEPTNGGYDSDGCFSGTCIKDANGVPTILYTGVKLRSNHVDDLPPTEADLNLPFIETQLAAVADPTPDDDLMVQWKKHPEPILSLPPPNSGLLGWRDPFIYRPGDSEKEWLMLVGGGIKGTGGTVLKYTSDNVFSNWKFAGYLCQGDADTGAMWECPLLRRLQPYKSRATERSAITSFGGNGGTRPVDITTGLERLSLTSSEPQDEVDEQYSHFFCISPDAPANPVFYWLGHLDENDVFQIEKATKHKRLDLGDILYAPNLTEDEHGDTMLWGWLQERRNVGSYDYSGCLSIPRRLSIRKNKLFQEPAESINHLRAESTWQLETVPLFPEESIPIDDVRGRALDIEVVFDKGDSDASGLLIRSWRVGGEGTAAVVFDWERSCLEVVFEALNPDTMEFFLDADNSRRIGGPVDWHPGEPLQLRIVLDHSCLEIFTGTGEVLSTRVYRGDPVHEEDSGLDFVSFGGTSTLISAKVYELHSIWREDAALSPVAADAAKHSPFFGLPEMERRPTLTQAPDPMN